jgi:F0F1-type ATP synthase assembly protein I
MVQTGNVRDEGPLDTGKEEARYIRVSKFAAAALEFPSTILGGLFLGYALDSQFKTSPWLTTILTLVALLGAFIRLFQWVTYLSKRQK